MYFVGVQEEYELSVQLMLRRLGVPLETKLKRERNQQKKRYVTREQTRIKANEALISRLKDVNIFDLHLYYLAFFRFCSDISLYPDLYDKLKEETKTKCENMQL